jgi:rSAM-associated Gly-rich repeat protein
MNITRNLSLVSFLVALSTFNLPPTDAAVNSSPNSSNNAIETRLAKIATSLQARENQLSNEANVPGNIQLAGAFVNNANKKGFVNAPKGGGFVNANGGGFKNIHGGGGFVNNRAGGGFVNRH